MAYLPLALGARTCLNTTLVHKFDHIYTSIYVTTYNPSIF